MKITKKNLKNAGIYSLYQSFVKRVIPIMLCLLMPLVIYGQKSTIQGVVVDTHNEPVIGASIMVKGAKTGAVTDIDGKFSVSAATGDILVVSYVGMNTQEVPVGVSKILKITLTDNTKNLEEVVVIGYGTQKKKDLTTAVSSVSSKEIAERPITSAAQAIQGKAAGVQVVQPSGKPGVGMSVRVRGTTSINATNEPLYVVDGVPTTDISNINPTDIESMTVLKDASSAAIYGSRSANGVVLITTKRGDNSEGQVSFSTYYGFSNIGKKISTLNTEQYYDLIEEIYGKGFVDRTNTNYTNWNDEIFGTGIQQNYQLSLSGSTEKSKYFVSGGYQSESGIVDPAWFKRFSLRTNIDADVKKWLHFTSSINLSRTQRRNASDNESSGRGGVIMSVLNTPPFLKIWDDKNPGQYAANPFQPSWENPVAQASTYDMNIDYRIMGNAGLTVDILKDLKFKTTFSADFTSHHWDYFVDPVMTGYGRQNNGIGQAARDTYLTWMNENIFTYDKKWGKNTFSALAGFTAQEYHAETSYQYAKDFVKGVKNNKEYMTLNWANDVTSANTQASEWAMLSGVARLHYNWDSKYLLTGNLRIDASSKLHPNHRTQLFPSFSAGWRVSGEEFWENMLEVVNDLKLRASWGVTGNAEGLGNYDYLGIYGLLTQSTTGSGPSITRDRMSNIDLGWEQTSQYDIGLDLSLLNSRLVLTLDAYYKPTTDLLLTVVLASSTGVPSPTRNNGFIQNKGIEFQLTSHNLTGKFKWDTDWNMSFNKNTIEKLGLTKSRYLVKIESNDQYVIAIKEGIPMGSFYGYVAEGVDPETGNMVYKDLNGNGYTDPGDRKVIGNAQPDFTYGLTNNFSYKGLSLNFFIQGSYGNEIFNASRIDTEGMFDTKNQSTRVLDRWQRPGMITTIPRASTEGNIDNTNNSSRFVEDGSYLRLKTLTLSYSLPKSLLGKIKVSNATIYTTATNLFTLTKYMGYDPEVNYGGNSGSIVGVDFGTYPQSKSYIFGLNLSF